MATSTAEPLITVRNLSVVFATDEGQLRAVDRVSFSLRKGEILGLVGESGCGKSVTALSIMGLIPAPAGRVAGGVVRFEGQNLLNLPAEAMRRIRGRSISMIFQEPMTALSPLHRIGKQLVEAVQLHRDMSRHDAWKLGVEWLRKVGIPDPDGRMKSYPYELSGGMRQRVMIAMALILGPKLVIADEPTTALDVTIQAQILDLMVGMKDRDTSLLLITHDMGVIWETCDRVAVMYASRIVEEGRVRQVFDQPAHPYTEGLLKSMPALAAGGDRLPSIKGQVPSLLNLPRGCAFAERCPYMMPRCYLDSPDLTDLRDSRRAACFLAEDRLNSEPRTTD